ncbi:MAG: DivIVA domain-containing protein [Micropruina sp.]|nr:DivIVA domain-containing protein [Micropruina sp.]
MTLTLEQVRQTRFHLARRNGYEPVDVDNFVDKVEATLSQMTEENDALKKQLDSLANSEPTGSFVSGSGDDQDSSALRDELASSQAAAEGLREQIQAREAELAELRAQLEGSNGEAQGEIDRLRGELEGRNQELGQLRGELDRARGELDQARGELEVLRAQLASHDPNLGAELDRLRGELDQARQAVSDREAEVAALHGRLEGAEQSAAAVQAAQSGHVEHIVVTAAADAAPAVTKLLQMATEQAERLVGEAKEEADSAVQAAQAAAQAAVDEANRKAHEALTDARTRAERIESEARVTSERVTGEAQARADAVNGEADARRHELFSQLESERDHLRGRVDHLRSFEGRFRENLTGHLRRQIEVLESGVVEPDDVPSILDEPATQSATPRLDALLGDQN